MLQCEDCFCTSETVEDAIKHVCLRSHTMTAEDPGTGATFAITVEDH